MYYVLDEAPLGSTEDLAVIDEYPRIELDAWLLGKRFRVTIPEPLRIVLDDSAPGRLPDYFKGSIPLMSDRLLAALAAAGVDNLDTYRVELRKGDGSLASSDYKAVNVVGVVSAANMAESTVAEGLPVELVATSFDSIAIDEKKAGGLLMFRLAEAVTTLLIHERVKRYLEANGFGALGFIEPENWMT
jgi:hypothetical protein